MRPHSSSDEAHRTAFGISPPDGPYFATRLRDGLGERGHAPRRSRTERKQRAGQAAEEIGFRTCRGEGETHAARGLDDAGGDFQETKPQRRELGRGQFPGFGNGVAHGQHQPISGGVENEADLIGERRTAAGAIHRSKNQICRKRLRITCTHQVSTRFYGRRRAYIGPILDPDAA